MDKTKLLDIALVEWIATLKSRDRSSKSVRPNFEDLFQKWKDLEASFDDVYETHLPKAIKPTASVARSYLKALKMKAPLFDKSEKEFIEEWNGSIEGTGTEVFFEFFPAAPIDHDPEPKTFGAMSATEYKAQRRYADAFPTLDTSELIKAWKNQQEYNSDDADLLKNILGGGNNETNS
jgi:hypothetical protein